ncbi:MAG: DUF5663 domain-containing protein [Candidatus Moranbacteria bacterium]|nr:DUF5663 domain-containing protein [Candidatus Moranbacteria bacterium]
MPQDNQIQQTLVEELGIADLPQDKQEQLLIKMTEVILKRMFVETMDKLNEADQKAYEQMLDRSAEPAEVEKFLREKIGNYDQLLEKIVEEFKEKVVKAGNLV